MSKLLPWISGIALMAAASALAPAASAQGMPEGGDGAGAGSAMTGAPSEAVMASGSGVATKYWLRFMADSTPTLWLFIDNGWRRMDTPSAQVTESVQEAFCGCTNPLEVYASYSDGNLSWVVVRTK